VVPRGVQWLPFQGKLVHHPSLEQFLPRPYGEGKDQKGKGKNDKVKGQGRLETPKAFKKRAANRLPPNRTSAPRKKIVCQKEKGEGIEGERANKQTKNLLGEK